ncbi:MAG TPA: GNAT family N-acetyltransferase [Desulfomonilia bacterium]|nr:GNAT family N-acetyltransferase [Desulfomonilia bacterium]
MLITPAEVMEKIEPGMKIFLGTGVAEPRTLIKQLMSSDLSSLQDLELIQLVSLGDLITMKELQTQKFRLKTFFSGWAASEAITGGHVDLIPSRFTRIPALIESGQLPIDAAFIQVTPPNEAGYVSLGVSVDVARQAIERSELVVGEINTKVPYTFGDTFIPVSEFDHLVQSEDELLYFARWPVDEIFDQVAQNIASVVEDGSCISFSLGPLYEALAKHLVHKRNLGVHSPFFTDALMDLVDSGAVTNRNKRIYRGKSLVSYAFGTKELMRWLDKNPLVEFQGIDLVFSPVQIGRNPRFISIIPARKVDISGRIALHIGKGAIATTPAEAMDFINGAELSKGGCTIFALPSRNRKREPNILLSVEEFPNLLGFREAVDMVITEYGVANLKGRTVRERAQALIDVAHPDDRERLVEEAKRNNILYADQIFLPQCASLYPVDISARHTFKGGIEIRFRHIKPSDEEEMRRLFYRFSDQTVYYRYFSPIKTMPHAKMQQYVNVDCNRILAVVAMVGPPDQEHIIAEARFVKDRTRPYGDVAFVVDEEYQGIGIASYMFEMLIRIAKERGLQGFTADVLASNKAMLKVFEKSGLPVKSSLSSGAYEIVMPFYE